MTIAVGQQTAAAQPRSIRVADRSPGERPIRNGARDFVFQALATAALALGALYLGWRWTASLNPASPGFSVFIASAETLAYLGSILFFLSIWRLQDPPFPPAPRTVNDVLAEPLEEDRPLRVDVFVATYDEPVELVRLSVRDALALRYPHPLVLRVHVLDDGRRPEMRAMAAEEGAEYLARETNEGFKAGNLRHGLEQTDGDLFVICDADTRPLPALLEETLGHFRDPRVAWVQTPQSFYDVDPGTRLPDWLARRARFGRAGRILGRVAERLVGPVAVGADPLGTDPRAFYDVVQRGRNWCNAAFCCGAGSVHRREAVMDGALRRFAGRVHASVAPVADRVRDPALRTTLSRALSSQAARHAELQPYTFHVSEDIYTSVLLHADADRRWRSVFHPGVLTRMLSPQDPLAWTVQRFKYASGTLDLAVRDNPLRQRGLDAWQKLMYGATIYAYLAPLWTLPLMLAPVVYLLFGIAPVRAYDGALWAHLLPFLVASRLALWAGTWGVPTRRSEQYHLAAFWLNLRALFHVLARRPLRFAVTPKVRAARRAVRLAAPHLVLLAAMALAVAIGTARLRPEEPAALAAWAANVFWTLHNGASLVPFVVAALWPRARRESP